MPSDRLVELERATQLGLLLGAGLIAQDRFDRVPRDQPDQQKHDRHEPDYGEGRPQEAAQQVPC